MLTRAWILDILDKLPLVYWPVFFWEVWWFERYCRAYRAANPVGLLAIGVTQTGRIIIRLQSAGDRPQENDWTAHAPRAPWLRLDLTRLASAHSDNSGTAHPALTCHQPDIGLVSAHDRPATGPFLLDPG